MDTLTAQALIRFGLGRRGNEALPTEPVVWLQKQLEGDDTAVFDKRLPTTADGLTVLREQYKLDLPPGQSVVNPLFQADVLAQTKQLLETDQPFRERLVWFWANHFTVSTKQGGTNATVGPYIREAIRPNVTGPFDAMLIAVMRHPAMLMYLDNNSSFGPNSTAGKNQHRGLNENLARECLELHTVSPASGYTQADVTAFANIITGWSVELNRLYPGFVFRDGAHEPGTKVLMGRKFPQGEAGGIAALEFLANHPATHKHLATQLVRHFVADDPPPDAVRTIEGVLRDTNGDLGAASTALLHLEAAWKPLAKLRTPLDFSVATLRALDLPADKVVPLQGVLGNLGMPLWTAPLPNGWSDVASDWAAPEAMMRRVDWTYSIASRSGDRDPMEIADASLGPLLRPRTQDAMRHAGSRRDALTLLLTSPEFQRR
jgi:uncharacterized protein (DUF1800 family)